MKRTRLQRREGETCSWPRCKAHGESAYAEGATELNRHMPVQFCDQHHETFWEELRALWASRRPPEEPAVAVLHRLEDSVRPQG